MSDYQPGDIVRDSEGNIWVRLTGDYGWDLVYTRQPILDQLTPSTRVTLADAVDDDDPTIATVVEPTPQDRLDGARDMGSDMEHCVLVEWPTDLGRQWEYPEDLAIVTEEG